jgi:hypothetical protein
MGKEPLTDLDAAFPYWCEQCSLTFLSARDLELHLQGTHHKLTDSDKAFLRALRITPWEDE